MNRLLIIIVAVLTTISIASASSLQDYSVKVGEVVKLEIPESGRTFLQGASGKWDQWYIEEVYLEKLSSSWDYCCVRGKTANFNDERAADGHL